MGDPFKEAGIIPDVLDDIKPTLELEVKFPKGRIHHGTELRPSEAAHAPHVHWQAAAGAKHLLMMVDPDAPSRATHTYRNWRHWIVADIPGGDVSKGHTVSDYVGPGPPQGTGLHRYIFLLFEQPKEIHEAHMSTKGMDCAKFDVRAFMQKHGLGTPIGADWFVSQHE